MADVLIMGYVADAGIQPTRRWGIGSARIHPAPMGPNHIERLYQMRLPFLTYGAGEEIQAPIYW